MKYLAIACLIASLSALPQIPAIPEVAPSFGSLSKPCNQTTIPMPAVLPPNPAPEVFANYSSSPNNQTTTVASQPTAEPAVILSYGQDMPPVPSPTPEPAVISSKPPCNETTPASIPVPAPAVLPPAPEPVVIPPAPVSPPPPAPEPAVMPKPPCNETGPQVPQPAPAVLPFTPAPEPVVLPPSSVFAPPPAPEPAVMPKPPCNETGPQVPQPAPAVLPPAPALEPVVLSPAPVSPPPPAPEPAVMPKQPCNETSAAPTPAPAVISVPLPPVPAPAVMPSSPPCNETTTAPVAAPAVMPPAPTYGSPSNNTATTNAAYDQLPYCDQVPASMTPMPVTPQNYSQAVSTYGTGPMANNSSTSAPSSPYTPPVDLNTDPMGDNMGISNLNGKSNDAISQSKPAVSVLAALALWVLLG